jgi:RNA polymerase sigma-70 factor (ECF subfamily)
VTPEARSQIQAWLVRVADGDRAAFDPLFDALWPVVAAYCRRTLGDDASGDDAAQETLTRVLTRASELDPARDATAWVMGIATWECRTARRRAWRRREEAVVVEQAADGVDDTEQRDLIAHAVAVLGTLGAADIAAITAAITEDPGARDGVAPATFRKRLERAFGRLRTAWRSRHGES